jgi:hypothetical protein
MSGRQAHVLAAGKGRCEKNTILILLIAFLKSPVTKRLKTQ